MTNYKSKVSMWINKCYSKVYFLPAVLSSNKNKKVEIFNQLLSLFSLFKFSALILCAHSQIQFITSLSYICFKTYCINTFDMIYEKERHISICMSPDKTKIMYAKSVFVCMCIPCTLPGCSGRMPAVWRPCGAPDWPDLRDSVAQAEAAALQPSGAG